MYSILNYIGKKEVDLLEEMKMLDIKIYCEPFSGSFNTGFKLMDTGYKAKYILNDLDENIYNFWIQLKTNFELLEIEVNKLVNNIDKISNKNETLDENKIIYEYIGNKLKSEDSIERAAAEFIYRQSLTISGFKYRRSKIENKVQSCDFYLNSEYLKGVSINNKDYINIMNKYDSDNTFFLIDPPYTIDRTKQYYRCESEKFNHKQLYEELKTLKGKWLLTYNYDEAIIKLYKNYNIEIKERKIMGKIYRELYIRNY